MSTTKPQIIIKKLELLGWECDVCVSTSAVSYTLPEAKALQ